LFDRNNFAKILSAYMQDSEHIKKYWIDENTVPETFHRNLLRAFHACDNREYKKIEADTLLKVLCDIVTLTDATKYTYEKYIYSMHGFGDADNISAYYQIELKWQTLRKLNDMGYDISYYWSDDVDPEIVEKAANHFEEATPEDILNYHKEKLKNITLPANKNQISLVPKRVSELERVNEPIEYLIDGWMKKDSFNSIIGAAKAGKTQLSMMMAFCVQNGIPFMGCECKKADVLYVDFELEHNEIGKRINLLKQYYEMPDAEDYYYISASRDFANGTINMSGILEAVREAKKQNPNIKLCIFDCYYTFAEGDSNTETDTRKNLQPLKGLVDDMCVCYVHHTNKTSNDMTNLIYAAGGSGVHGKIVDSTYVVWPKSSKDNTFYIATTGRSGGGKKITCKKDESTFHQFKQVDDVDDRHKIAGKTVDKDPKEENPELWAFVSINGNSLHKVKGKFGFSGSDLAKMGYNVDYPNKKVYRP
jgi:hypothetical protein